MLQLAVSSSPGACLPSPSQRHLPPPYRRGAGPAGTVDLLQLAGGAHGLGGGGGACAPAHAGSSREHVRSRHLVQLIVSTAGWHLMRLHGRDRRLAAPAAHVSTSILRLPLPPCIVCCCMLGKSRAGMAQSVSVCSYPSLCFSIPLTPNCHLIAATCHTCQWAHTCHGKTSATGSDRVPECPGNAQL